MVIAIWELTNIPCPYFKWKQLALEFHLTNCVQVGLSTLLRRVPLLETLKIHVKPITDAVWHDGMKWLVEYELDGDKYWNENEASLKNLKTVLIHGCCITVEPAVIRVAKFILRNANALEKMVISSKNLVDFNDPSYVFTSGNGIEPEEDRLLTDELTCLLENLLTFPKASTNAVICFI